MAHISADRVQETTTTTGTGALTLAGAATNFKTFASRMAVSDTCWYAVIDSTNNAWEVGLGTYSGVNTLTRTTVLKSSNSDTVVTLAAGTKNVFITLAGDKNVIIDGNNTVALPDNGTTTPATPSGSSVHLFSRQKANRKMPAFIGPNGFDSMLQPMLSANKVGYWNPPGNAPTVPGVFGLTAFTAMTGATVTTRTVATTNLATRMRRIGYPSAATAGSFAGARIVVNQFSPGSGAVDGSGFFLVERWVESDPAPVAGKRAFAGLSNVTTTATNVEPNTLTNAIGLIQLSSDSTQWYWYAGGTTANFVTTAVGTGVGAPGGNSTTAWELAVYCPNSVANTYYMQLTNISTGATASTTITGNSVQVPVSSVLLSWKHWASNNATAAAVGIDFCSLYVETDT